MKSASIYIVILLAAVFGSCVSREPQTAEEQRLFQISTIDALLQGDYDGYTCLKEIATKGDFGIGTVDGLDGELILADGNFYQVKADGKVYRPSVELKTPFASVVKFSPEDSLKLDNISFANLKIILDSLMQSKNYFYAIRVEGEFDSIRTRSVPAQHKPYPALSVVTQNQPEFSIRQSSGKLTGFFCPDFTKGINMPGVHLHYLADDQLSGGHLLDFHLKSGILKLDKITRFEMVLPESGSFRKTEYKTDRSAELKKVEG